MKNVSLRQQINNLAEFIMWDVEGEPSRSEGAVECAIRLMRERNSYKDDLLDLEYALKAWKGQPDVWERVNMWLFNCKRHITDISSNLTAKEGIENGIQ